MFLTRNEKKVLRLLATSYGQDYSINEIAKQCGLTPNGAYKLLKKLEREGILKVKSIANIKSYKLNFEDEKTTLFLELTFMPESLEGKIKIRAEDFKPLQQCTQSCILFGSYITSKAVPHDLDVLFIIKKNGFKTYKQILSKVQDITPVKIHDVIQTYDDLGENIRKGNPALNDALRKGIVLWGSSVLVQVIKNVSR